MKITKARLKQIIKEEMKSLEEKKKPNETDAEYRARLAAAGMESTAPKEDGYFDSMFAKRRAERGQATWEDEEDAQQTLPSDTQTPASAADINPIGAKIGQAIVNPVQAAKDAATAAGFGKFFQDPKKVEPAKDKAVKAAKATKSGGGGLKAAKARMSAARKAVKKAMKAAGVSSIYKLPKTKGSPRKEFADAYTALKRAKAGKAPRAAKKAAKTAPKQAKMTPVAAKGSAGQRYEDREIASADARAKRIAKGGNRVDRGKGMLTAR